VTQLSQTTQQNASSSEELAATAEEMSSQAEQLQQAMSFFKLAAVAPSIGRSRSTVKSAAVKRQASAHSRRGEAGNPINGRVAANAGADSLDESQFARF
jgi:methyl-accepting chemotaxis protein